MVGRLGGTHCDRNRCDRPRTLVLRTSAVMTRCIPVVGNERPSPRCCAHDDYASRNSPECVDIGVAPNPRGDVRRARRTRRNRQVFGLTGIDLVRPTLDRTPSCTTPSLPRTNPVLCDGGRSRSPLRDSPGFPPDSLSPCRSVSSDSRPAGSTPHTDTTVHDEPAALTSICPARDTRSGRSRS